MECGKNTKTHLISFYIYAGLAFLLWENLVSSVLGMYNLELRRTLCGVIYYSLLFLIFGGFTKGINFLYSKIFPKHCWSGQEFIWFYAILVIILWGDIFRQFLIALFSIQSVRWSYRIDLIWLPLVGLFALGVNFLFARLERTDKLLESRRLVIYYITAILYIIISVKVTYRHFQNNIFNPINILLQPAFVFSIFLLTRMISSLFSSARALRWALIWVPLVLTFAIVGFQAGMTSIHTQGNDSHPVQPASDQPNVVVLLFDALRADHVGVIGSESSLTPTMDTLARQGKVYPVCYSTSCWTFPAVVSILTSKLPNKLGLLQTEYIPEEIPTVTGILSENGYYTMAVSSAMFVRSKWGSDRSFDEFDFIPGVGSKQLFLPFKSFFPYPGFLDELAYQFGFISTDVLVADWKQMNKRAEKFMEKAIQKPFFLYVHFNEPHTPYLTIPFQDGILNLKKLKLFYDLFKLINLESRQRNIKKKNHFLIETQHARYNNGVLTADRAVSEFLKTVDRLGLKDNTIIIIISDHGEEFFERDRIGHKSSLFEEQVRVPLIIYIPPGLRISLTDQPDGVSLLDIAPTVLDLTGIGSDLLDSDGYSLLQSYPAQHRLKYMVFQWKGFFWSAVVSGHYKLILKENLMDSKIDTMLFNLNYDIGEKENLYPEKKYLADSLAIYLQEQLDQTIQSPEAPFEELTPHEIQQLKALGYVD